MDTGYISFERIMFYAHDEAIWYWAVIRHISNQYDEHDPSGRGELCGPLADVPDEPRWGPRPSMLPAGMDAEVRAIVHNEAKRRFRELAFTIDSIQKVEREQ